MGHRLPARACTYLGCPSHRHGATVLQSGYPLTACAALVWLRRRPEAMTSSCAHAASFFRRAPSDKISILSDQICVWSLRVRPNWRVHPQALHPSSHTMAKLDGAPSARDVAGTDRVVSSYRVTHLPFGQRLASDTNLHCTALLSDIEEVIGA